MTESLKQLEEQLAELRAKYEAEQARVRTETLAAIALMLESGTLKVEDLRALLPAANPNRRKPGPKPKAAAA